MWVLPLEHSTLSNNKLVLRVAVRKKFARIRHESLGMEVER